MTETRKIEIFSAGCPICEDTIALVNRLAGPSSDISVLDMNDAATAARAASLGVRAVPAVAIEGALAACCAGAGVNETDLRAAGIG
jgi:hypothetical protein